jgi:hypothetical protein
VEVIFQLPANAKNFRQWATASASVNSVESVSTLEGSENQVHNRPSCCRCHRLKHHTPDEPESHARDCSGTEGSFVIGPNPSGEDLSDDPQCRNVLRDGEQDKEHIAGPNCTSEFQGYLGWRVRADEMRVCLLTSLKVVY